VAGSCSRELGSPGRSGAQQDSVQQADVVHYTMVTVLVDTSHLLYRSHHTFNKFSTSSGMSTGVHFGVMRTIEHIHKSYPGCVIIFALDGHPVGRKELYPLYKANRTGQPQSHGDIIHDFGVTVDIKELVPQSTSPSQTRLLSILVMTTSASLLLLGLTSGSLPQERLIRNG
jgi:hypothetical protein